MPEPLIVFADSFFMAKDLDPRWFLSHDWVSQRLESRDLWGVSIASVAFYFARLFITFSHLLRKNGVREFSYGCFSVVDFR